MTPMSCHLRDMLHLLRDENCVVLVCGEREGVGMYETLRSMVKVRERGCT